MSTPFHFRSALDPNDPNQQRVTVPRTDLVEQLVQDIAAVPVRYPLIRGPRQIGKSTACLQLVNRIHKDHPQDWLACHVDCGAVAGADTEALVSLLHTRVLQEGLRSVETLPGNLKPTVDVLSAMEHPETLYEFGLFLDQVATVLPSIARLALVVDEIEVVPWAVLCDALRAFRAFHHKYALTPEPFTCCVVIACTQDLAALEIGAGSPYNIAWPRDLEGFPVDEWRDVLSNAGCPPFTQPALDRLFNEVSGCPYLLQRVCDRAVSNAEHDEADCVTEGHVLDGICWLFEKGDRDLKIVAHQGDATPARKALCARLLRGEIVTFQATRDSVSELAEIGLIVDRNKRAAFRNVVYERLMLNRRYRDLGGPEGKYLHEHGYLLVDCSEIQRAVLNVDLLKEVFPILAKAQGGQVADTELLLETCCAALGRSQNPAIVGLDIDFVNATLSYVLGEAHETPLDRPALLEVIGRLLVEKFEHK